MWLTDRLVCAARSAYYATERPRLWLERKQDEAYWGGDPLVSVIIPTHNRAELLIERSLPSVLAQTYRNIEVLVMAHGCTDSTRYRVLLWAVQQSSRSRAWEMVHGLSPGGLHVIDVRRHPTYPPTAMNHWYAGPVDPLNAGLEAARGAWIARIDDDDVWQNDHIERLLMFAQVNDYEFVSSAHDTPEGKVESYEIDGVEIGGCQTWLYRSYLKFMKYNPDCWRKSWDRVNDTDLQRRMVNAGVRMGYLDRVTAHVIPRPGERHVGSKAYTADPAKAEKAFAFN